MKNKIIVFTISIILFSIVVSTVSSIAISNYQYVNVMKANLKEHNKMLTDIINNNDNPEKILKSLSKGDKNIRITYLDIEGNVIYDTEGGKLDNHLNRKEIKGAINHNQESDIRYSETLKKDMLYYALRVNNNSIIRTAVPISNINTFIRRNSTYYVITALIILIITLIIALKFTSYIVMPLSELEDTAYKISKGELNKRISIVTDDEIGKLGTAFNYLADSLDEALRDVTDKQTRLEAILKSMDSGIIAVDRNHNVIMINPCAVNIFGIKEDILGKKLINAVRDFDIDSIFDSDKEFMEVTIIYPQKKNLRIRTAEITIKNEHIGRVAVIQDITDLKNIEQMRVQFVANVSHELKTPLTSIKGFAETLQDVEDKEVQKKFIKIINDEADRLTRIINDLLELSKLDKAENTNDKDELVLFNTDEIILDITSMLEIESSKKCIKIYNELDNKKRILGNIDEFKQMLIILVDNAIKYTESGGNIYVRTYNSLGNVIIEVEDTGIGIPEKDLPRIFERFYRVDKARSRAKGGTGLGLSILKHLLIKIDGAIEVKSTLGVGSKFIIKIKGQ
ncbi:ATP-binding protein [Inconstantimicrobium porci]|uniref:histidine kinase n=1 Tax=Inconstantimicrobium porci TaxID=2652291 RepID=A0A7X2MW99_9CLOT|nr:ATP-binding protein [Inconstantimicrobium porci]MSR90205.1 HAMP domain-containing protein [Inconstantimicrobium porci]